MPQQLYVTDPILLSLAIEEARGLREAKRLGQRYQASLGLTPAAQALLPPGAAFYTKLSTFQGGSEPQRGKVPAQGHTAQADAGRSRVWGLKGREPEALRGPTTSLLGWNPHMPVLSPGQPGGGS